MKPDRFRVMQGSGQVGILRIHPKDDGKLMTTCYILSKTVLAQRDKNRVQTSAEKLAAVVV